MNYRKNILQKVLYSISLIALSGVLFIALSIFLDDIGLIHISTASIKYEQYAFSAISLIIAVTFISIMMNFSLLSQSVESINLKLGTETKEATNKKRNMVFSAKNLLVVLLIMCIIGGTSIFAKRHTEHQALLTVNNGLDTIIAKNVEEINYYAGGLGQLPYVAKQCSLTASPSYEQKTAEDKKGYQDTIEYDRLNTFIQSNFYLKSQNFQISIIIPFDNSNFLYISHGNLDCNSLRFSEARYYNACIPELLSKGTCHLREINAGRVYAHRVVKSPKTGRVSAIIIGVFSDVPRRNID